MPKHLVLTAAVMLSSLSSANAACPSFPNQFTNGSTADATQVNSNFQNVIACFAPLANPQFSGNVGIGNTPGGWSGNSVLSASYPFNNGWAISAHYANSSPIGGGALLLRTDATAAPLSLFYVGSSTNVGSITTNGASTYFNTSSDYRLKTNVEPLTGGVALLMQLRPRRFNWTIAPADPKSLGFLAHELQAVVPSAVVGEKDAVNQDGSIKPQQVDYSKLVPLLVAAIKDQQNEIEELRHDLEAVRASR